MNETKPTAKAASDGGVDAVRSSVEGGQLGVEPARVVGVEAGPARRAAGVGGRARRQRRAVSHARARARRAPPSTGTSQAGEVEAAAPPARPARAGRTPPTSASLICSLVLPWAISSAMNVALLVGHVGGRDVQRRPALQAHHLVLDVGQRGARLGGRGGRGEAARARAARRAARASRRLVEQRRQRLVEPLLGDRHAPHGGDLARRGRSRRSRDSPSGPTRARSCRRGRAGSG